MLSMRSLMSLFSVYSCILYRVLSGSTVIGWMDVLITLCTQNRQQRLFAVGSLEAKRTALGRRLAPLLSASVVGVSVNFK